MNTAPFFDAAVAIQIHTLCALLALALTPVVLSRRKGDRLHKLMGRVWVLIMAVTALSSFAITQIKLIGPYSPIHILSLVTLISLFQAVRFARQRRIAAHKQAITGAAAGLVGAGLFTLLPGRLMSEIIFGSYAVQGFLAALALTLGAAIIWRINLGFKRGAAV